MIKLIDKDGTEFTIDFSKVNFYKKKFEEITIYYNGSDNGLLLQFETESETNAICRYLDTQLNNVTLSQTGYDFEYWTREEEDSLVNVVSTGMEIKLGSDIVYFQITISKYDDIYTVQVMELCDLEDTSEVIYLKEDLIFDRLIDSVNNMFYNTNIPQYVNITENLYNNVLQSDKVES